MCNILWVLRTLPVNYALDLRKLSFQHKQSVHHIPVMIPLFSLTARRSLNCCVRTTLLFSLRLMDGFVLVCGKHSYVI